MEEPSNRGEELNEIPSLNIIELTKATAALKNIKAPGSHGIPAEIPEATS